MVVLCLVVLTTLLYICPLDGRLLFVTPMDPLFLILYYLIKADKEVSLLLIFLIDILRRKHYFCYCINFMKRDFRTVGNIVCI